MAEDGGARAKRMAREQRRVMARLRMDMSKDQMDQPYERSGGET